MAAVYWWQPSQRPCPAEEENILQKFRNWIIRFMLKKKKQTQPYSLTSWALASCWVWLPPWLGWRWNVSLCVLYHCWQILFGKRLLVLAHLLHDIVTPFCFFCIKENRLSSAYTEHNAKMTAGFLKLFHLSFSQITRTLQAGVCSFYSILHTS